MEYDHNHDPPIEEPPPVMCKQLRRRREYDRLLTQSEDRLVIICAAVPWSLHMSIPWYDNLSVASDTTAILVKIDLDSGMSDWFAELHDCQFRPSYFYIRDRELVHHTKGDTETTFDFVSHYAKHGKPPPGVEEVVPKDLINVTKPDGWDEEYAAKEAKREADLRAAGDAAQAAAAGDEADPEDEAEGRAGPPVGLDPENADDSQE